MSVFTVVPSTATLSGWLIIAGFALLFLTLATGVVEWLAHCRRQQTPVAPRPNIDDLALWFGDEEYQARADARRLGDL